MIWGPLVFFSFFFIYLLKHFFLIVLLCLLVARIGLKCFFFFFKVQPVFYTFSFYMSQTPLLRARNGVNLIQPTYVQPFFFF